MRIEIDRIIYSRRRKTVSLIITEDARLTVRAPYGIAKNRIIKIVQEKRKWIEKKQTEIKSRNKTSLTGEFKEGEILHYLGKPYRIKYVPRQSSPLIFGNDSNKESTGEEVMSTLFIDESYRDKKEILLKLFIDFYSKKTREEINRRIGEFSKLFLKLYGLRYRRIRISKANKRLGSCSSLGNINFSWRLSMAPPEIIDYIVIHELAHLREQNHSKKFWKLVEKLMPNYRACKKWIRDNYYLLKLTF